MLFPYTVLCQLALFLPIASKFCSLIQDLLYAQTFPLPTLYVRASQVSPGYCFITVHILRTSNHLLHIQACSSKLQKCLQLLISMSSMVSPWQLKLVCSLRTQDSCSMPDLFLLCMRENITVFYAII